VGVVQTLRLFFPLCDEVGQGRALFEDRLRFLLVLPEFIRRGQRVQLGGAGLFASDVKDASRGS
jgi:hypothetical protein